VGERLALNYGGVGAFAAGMKLTHIRLSPRRLFVATRTTTARTAPSGRGSDYVIPVIHAKVPASVGDGVFWAFVGVALAGVVDPPIAAFAAAGFLVARRRRQGMPST